MEEDFLVFLIEFIVSGSISHLFTYEEQTTIINSIRTEVTLAGLTYTADTEVVPNNTQEEIPGRVSCVR
jgi:dynein heavy chain